MTKRNRKKVVEDRWEKKAEKGVQAKHEEYKLSWFRPTPKQSLITDSMRYNSLTAIQGSSGTGKSTTVIWQGLQDLKKGLYSKIVFVKTAVETCDDKIGFLSGTADDKLEKHFESMRTIFQDFMSKEKLAMEEKRDHIEFTIPNFIMGRTISNSLIIIDEAQVISPKILKLLMERAGEGSRIVVMGDNMQTYAKDKRIDGFSDFVHRITEVEGTSRSSRIDSMGYVELGAGDNMRSELSRNIVRLYEGDL